MKLPYKLFVHRGLGLIDQLAKVVRNLSNLFLDYLLRVLFDAMEKLLHFLVDSFIHEPKLILISHAQVMCGGRALDTQHRLVLGDHSLVVSTELLVLFQLLKHKRLDFFLHLVNVYVFLSLVNGGMLRSRGMFR